MVMKQISGSDCMLSTLALPSLLDKGPKVYSAEGNQCLTIFKEPESYTSLEKALSEIVKKI